MTEQYFEDNVVKFKFIQVHLWQKICKSLLQRNQTVKGLKDTVVSVIRPLYQWRVEITFIVHV